MGDNRFASMFGVKKGGKGFSSPGCLEKNSASFPIEFLSQPAGAFECDDFPRIQHEIAAGRGVSSSSLIFPFYAEFAEAGYEYIFSFFELPFHDFKERFNNIDGFFLGEPQLMHLHYDIMLCQCHCASSSMKLPTRLS
jgi:hypothetical protein